MKTKQNAIIYCRVSTIKQGKTGDSLNNQEDACRKYCKYNNIKVLDVFKEEFTGKSSHRPEFNNAISKAIDNQVAYFIVFDIDRFSREGYEVYSNFKNLLKDNGIKLRDSKNVIGDERIVIKNDNFDMSEYKWNQESPTEMAEMVYSAQAKIEGNKIMQRTIPKEINLEQNGYHPRGPNYGYELKKVNAGELGKAKIQVKHPLEGNWVIEMFEERAKGLLNDKEIIRQVNLKGAIKRKNARLTKDTPIDVKYLQELIKNPIYAGIKVAKWNKHKPLKQKYDGLVNIDTWNKANRGKYKIVELQNGEIKIYNGKTDIKDESLVQRRNKFNPNLPFRNLVKSDLIEGAPISGSYSNPKRKKSTGYYHPIRKKGVKGENLRKEEFESKIYSLFDDIKIDETLKIMLIDRFDYIYEENKKDVYKNKNILLERLKDIRKEKDIQEANIDNAFGLSRVLHKINDKLEKLDIEEEKLKDEINKLENCNYLKNEGFKNFCFKMLEHFEVLLSQSKNFDELDIIFRFVFQERPTYKQIVNRTPELYPIFALQSKKELQLNGNSSVNLKWQAHEDSNPERGIWSPAF